MNNLYEAKDRKTKKGFKKYTVNVPNWYYVTAQQFSAIKPDWRK